MHKRLAWWQLSLIGIGSIIGAGFFLGSGLSIGMAGPSVLIGYIIAGLATFIVFAALAEMTVNDPQPGSFRTYARLAFGRSAGFMSGWIYWLAGVLIMSSEIVALSTFTQYWFPNIPLGIFSVLYAVLGFGINFMGVRNFGAIESVFAVIKLTILILFILFGVLFVCGLLSDSPKVPIQPIGRHDWFPHGLSGLWSAMIFVFFSFGGIEVVGVTASELKRGEEIAKAGLTLLVVLVLVYVLALFGVLKMTEPSAISDAASPFVTALSGFRIPYLGTLFNLIIISAAFSTMVGALFGVSRVMVSLAEDGDAPRSLKQVNSRGVASKSLWITAAALTVTIVCSYILPHTMYEYVSTAAGAMLILNWILILASSLKLRSRCETSRGKLRIFTHPYGAYVGMVLILVAISGALLHRNERIGLGLSLALILLVFAASRIVPYIGRRR
ncbi:amino acid permease [Paenibacillus lignilyticus]|uniref:Amino acid permease n=1 Tax=Paenibacillus lignilyticus TaxID=1172615 RepID=A0ABS5CJI0_9BACL|nr:amino acid permease [Paenibacillus lignilyticus]MBP3966035.1 amino acid permease [Paenibacillus lignilyticus]